MLVSNFRLAPLVVTLAVGANPIAACISGIGVNRYRVAAYASDEPERR